MKKIYEFETWEKVALNRRKFCPKCGAHSYKICHRINMGTQDLEANLLWHIECADCGFEGPDAFNKKLAMREWMYL